MKEFIEVLAPFKKNCLFKEEVIEGMPEALKSESSKKEVFLLAILEEDIPCSYALASTIVHGERITEINGKKMELRSVKYFKVKSYFKKDANELEVLERAKTISQISLEFGSAAFTRGFKKRKQLSEVSVGLESKTEIVAQMVTSDENNCTTENIHRDIQPVFPVKNPYASTPMELYTLESILGFNPDAIINEHPNIQKDKEMNICSLTAAVLDKEVVTYSKNREKYVWTAVFDSICKIILGHRKVKLNYLYETEDLPQALMIKHIVRNMISPLTLLNTKIIIDKELKDKLIARISVLILLKDNGILNIQKYTACFFGCDLGKASKILTGLGCVKLPTEKTNGKALVFSLELPNKAVN